VNKVFAGSPTALVQTLVSDKGLSEDEFARIRAAIDGMEQDDV
jgi:hypothetical protein